MVAPIKAIRDALNWTRNMVGKLRYNIDGPVIVFNAGKVGSRSVYETLDELRPGVPVYHRHILYGFDKMEEAMVELARKNNQPPPVATLHEINEGRKLRQKMEESGNRRWNIITLVRDPVAQSISQFFHYIGDGELIHNGRERILSGEVGAKELVEIFLDTWKFRFLGWFEKQFEPATGIDVYSKPFPHEKGYDIFREGHFKALVVRLEDLDRCAGEALEMLLGISGIEIKKRNTAGDRWYSDVYREFRSRIVVPDECLVQVYGSRFSRHFYSPEELERFRCRWKKTK